MNRAKNAGKGEQPNGVYWQRWAIVYINKDISHTSPLYKFQFHSHQHWVQKMFSESIVYCPSKYKSWIKKYFKLKIKIEYTISITYLILWYTNKKKNIKNLTITSNWFFSKFEYKTLQYRFTQVFFLFLSIIILYLV